MSITLVLGCTAACNGKSNNAEKEYNVQLETPPKATDELILYQSPYSAKLIQNAVPIFKAKFPDVKVEIKTFGTSMMDPDANEQIENYKTVLKSELMSGQGPDLILWNNEPGPLSKDGFSDIYKVLDAGTMYNLDNFIQNDTDFGLYQ